MKVLVLGIGKTKHKFLIEGISKYIKQSAPFFKIEEKYLKDEATKEETVELESQKLLKSIPNSYYKILLDLKGEQLDSVSFSKKLNFVRNNSNKYSGIVFIIGGHLGVNNDLRKSIDLLISFSKFTFTHQMVRLILLEQIYRAFTIMNNKKYHK